MDAALGNDQTLEADFRRSVRSFLDAKLTAEMRAEAARQAGVYAHPSLARQWHRILYEQGWIAPAWPVEHGGTGWSSVQRLIFESECALAGAPVLPAMGLQLCGPILIAYGTEAQKARFLPRILSGEDYWCQGYSEPQAGSDLASLSTRARLAGDRYVIDGSKIWTTHAQFADWIFLLVRTSRSGPPQAGISFMICPMNAPGLSVSPIISISGEHEVNQVFFDSVELPVDHRIGAENEGWAIAKHLLQIERAGSSATGRALRVMLQLYALAASNLGGHTMLDNPHFRRKLAEIEIEIGITAVTQRRLAENSVKGDADAGRISSILKLKAAECYQAATELALQAIGEYGIVDQVRTDECGGQMIGPEAVHTPLARYLNARAMTIFGGASEVQNDIIGRSMIVR